MIGSNRQKGCVISEGIVPQLIALVTNDEVPLKVRLDSVIIIGMMKNFRNLLYFS